MDAQSVKTVIGETKSVCPECLKVISARKVDTGKGIYLEKRCEDHGEFRTLIWEGSRESYEKWGANIQPADRMVSAKPVKDGCPCDCGLCQAHERRGCCVLLELTTRCNLHCPVCFAEAGEGRGGDTPLEGGVGKTYGELLEILRREKPETFVGMPVPLLSLLRLEERCSIKRARISADFCPDTVCREIENLLGTRPYPHYGSREIGLGGAVTCQAFEGMHIRENDIYPEIIDKEGRVLPDGEWGELVITTMEAEAMPLIRYRTGDRTRILKEPCPCGSCITRIDRLRRMGKENPMEELDEVIFREKNVIDYQGILKNGEIYIKGYKKEETEVSGLPEKIGEYPLRFEWTEVKERFTPCYPAKRRLLTGEEL